MRVFFVVVLANLLAASSAFALDVDLGADQQLSLPFNTASFSAEVSGAEPSAVSFTWELVAGPSTGRAYPFSSNEPSQGQLFVEETGTYVVRVTATSAGQSASDTATVYVNDHFERSIPGRLEAEDANLGNGLGYTDTSTGNSGGVYRSDDLDVQATGDIGGGFNVGWISAGERLDFSVLSQSGFYDVVVRVAANSSGPKSFRLLINGREVSGTVTFDTGGAGWQTYQDVVIPNVESFGRFETVTFIAETGGFNLNYLEFVPAGNN